MLTTASASILQIIQFLGYIETVLIQGIKSAILTLWVHAIQMCRFILKMDSLCFLPLGQGPEAAYKTQLKTIHSIKKNSSSTMTTALY